MRFAALFCLITFILISTFTYSQDIQLDVEGNVKIVGKVDLVVNESDSTSVAIGRGAGDSLKVDVGDNTFFGVKSGNITQAQIFHQAGFAEGVKNSFFGFSSGIINYNGSSNSFYGSHSGKSNTSGSSNSFFGDNAGQSNTTGNNNSYFGQSSGTFQKGNKNTFIGALAGASLAYDSLINSIAFGYRSIVGCSNCAVIGGTVGEAVDLGLGVNIPFEKIHLHEGRENEHVIIKFSNQETGLSPTRGLHIGLLDDGTGVYQLYEDRDFNIMTNNATRMTIKNDGKVGVGTATPELELDVQGNIQAISPGSEIAYVRAKEGSQVALIATNEAENYIRIDVGGTNHSTDDIIIGDPGTPLNKVGIGTSSPTEMLDIDGNIRVRNVGAGALDNDIGITIDGVLTTASSDRRLKKEIETYDNALSKLMSVRGVSFKWKDEDADRKRLGVIAQEVEKHIPEVVFKNDGYLGVNYSQLSAVFIEAIKLQQKQIESLTEQNELLKLENTNMQKYYRTLREDHNSLKDQVSTLMKIEQ